MSKYETKAGHVTRGETLAKLIDLVDQLIDQSSVMGHLHNTEDSTRDHALAEGWLAMSHAFQIIRVKILELAKGNLH